MKVLPSTYRFREHLNRQNKKQVAFKKENEHLSLLEASLITDVGEFDFSVGLASKIVTVAIKRK
jgi:hypothetical protein